MSISMSELSTPVLVRGLKVLATLLAKGEAHAASTGMAAEGLLGARLAPDMLPLSAQLQERIAKTIAYLDSIEPALIDSGADGEIRLNWTPTGPVFNGKSYLLTFALPNFFFHVTTAHGILRNQGVKIGKSDYLGSFIHE